MNTFNLKLQTPFFWIFQQINFLKHEAIPLVEQNTE